MKINYSNAYSNQDEKSAIDLFIKTYKERDRSAVQSTRQEADKQQFVEANKSGQEHFNNKNFSDALIEFNRALSITDWKDDYNWIEIGRASCRERV